ncbi:hypothetical protein Ae168Ps1_4947 [Pseudonocardia sp. Ae168_Ps1]|nr:hypothetical protein Ae150APs1_4909 [Pseudonocardia sp. Ae150A_Ps1]OLL82541.1 hypothetical protein Ae168Ps1_4947 [Pseudonocardia sp. Ae168_Ps1]OLL83345.1 hypothetical protein Ae263Ps1_0400c [Pseudonocardia sp. Ae263_Ps1]OLL90617.1 hypothetical protein Ae356Ps1_0514 [Pseudonocardia sp. Ae356_Ps1]
MDGRLYSGWSDRSPFTFSRSPDAGDVSQERNLISGRFLSSAAPHRDRSPSSRGGGREPPPGRLPEPEVTR